MRREVGGGWQASSQRPRRPKPSRKGRSHGPRGNFHQRRKATPPTFRLLLHGQGLRDLIGGSLDDLQLACEAVDKTRTAVEAATTLGFDSHPVVAQLMSQHHGKAYYANRLSRSTIVDVIYHADVETIMQQHDFKMKPSAPGGGTRLDDAFLVDTTAASVFQKYAAEFVQEHLDPKRFYTMRCSSSEGVVVKARTWSSVMNPELEMLAPAADDSEFHFVAEPGIVRAANPFQVGYSSKQIIQDHFFVFRLSSARPSAYKQQSGGAPSSRLRGTDVAMCLHEPLIVGPKMTSIVVSAEATRSNGCPVWMLPLA